MSDVKLRGFRGWASLASPRWTRRTRRRWWTRARPTLHGTWRFGYRLGHWSPRGPCARWRSGWFGGRRFFGRLWGRGHFRWLGFGGRWRSFIFDFFGFFSHFFYFFSFFFFYFFFSLWGLVLFITYDKNRISIIISIMALELSLLYKLPQKAAHTFSEMLSTVGH